MAAAARAATGTATRRRLHNRLGAVQEAEPAKDDAADRFAGLRVRGKRLVMHALLELEMAWFFARQLRDGLIDVGGHGGF